VRRSRKSSPLPVRDGVSPQSVFLPQGPWPTVLAFLCERFPAVGLEQWHQRMSVGEVVDGQGRALAPDQSFLPGTRIYYYRSVADEVRIPFDEIVLHRDDHLLVVDKPHFLPTQPAGPFVQETLVARLRRRLGIDQLEPLHRLDRDTAGLVLLSVNPASRDAYHALFRERQVQKIYQAIAPAAPGRVFPLDYSSRIVRDSVGYRHREEPGPPNSATRIDLMQSQGDWARYRLQPHTGRTHQLRVHMAALGLPIRHDPLYPVDEHRPPDDFSRPLQLLASELRFDDPFTGESRCFRTGFSLILPGG
jgi:tRNA pseudouridine32 synthase/23S rRNA pseudouridine746 synthase